MPVIVKPVEELTEADLQRLVTARVNEQRTVEYKVAPPRNSDSDKRELAADFSSFANGSGGHIIYGMRAEKGIPLELVGIPADSADDELVRLRQVMDSWIEPKLAGVQFAPIRLPNNTVALVAHIPRSWIRPHAVTHPGHPGSLRFFSRDSNGKRPLDVAQARAAFVGSETAAARTRTFRLDRLAQITAGETPVALPSDPIAVLHLVPIGAFDLGASIQLLGLSSATPDLSPRSTTRLSNHRHNLDGFLAWEPQGGASGLADAYVQIFRNGIIEDVDAASLRVYDGGTNISAISFEEEWIWALPLRLGLMQALGVDTPIVAMLSLLGVKGLTIDAREARSWMSHREPDAIDRDVLALPDILIESYNCDAAEALRPVFDAVWNAAGYGRSLGYDEQGKRKRTGQR